jgi:hypothetical protein
MLQYFHNPYTLDTIGFTLGLFYAVKHGLLLERVLQLSFFRDSAIECPRFRKLQQMTFISWRASCQGQVCHGLSSLPKN